MRMQRPLEFRDDGPQLVFVPCCYGLSAQLTNASLQSDIQGHGTPLCGVCHSQREVFDTVHTVLPAPDALG